MLFVSWQNAMLEVCVMFVTISNIFGGLLEYCYVAVS